MDIYSRKSRWKIYLAAAGALIVAISVLYTNYLAGKLAKEEENKVRLWAQAQDELDPKSDEELERFANCSYILHLNILESNTTIPVMLVDERGRVIDAVNFSDTSQVYLKKELAKMVKLGVEPIQGFAYSIYYKESTILRQLRFFPLIQLLLIAAFIFLGYLAFNAARRAEQNRVWAGMAKETAHQLGTPISAIIAWIEHLRTIQDDETQDILNELQSDVDRLELIADRFSKIGSAPKLEHTDVYTEIEKCFTYMQRRASRKVSFEFEPPEEKLLLYINPPLFDWVVENLLRNALDATEGKGKISAEVYEDQDFAYVDISDTGKGIPNNKFKTVFQPGYTTKKRGWGLGLSLTKRIIEEYHGGKIHVKKSVEGEGTTFTIKLPKKIVKQPAEMY
ncbi:MAG: HAMP domain-containing sensor histidine kinase [Saprospiraceae bacterium]|nr:HAMP domain-containing sensor histidine kinase [Saprospiraceae bacterium]MDZ4704911.1 HAMP domain-containing sensor histidine kinase [Saprospiraceae bacterium]